MNRRHSADRFFRKYAQLKRKRAGQFSLEINGASAHPGDYSGVLDFFAEKLDENNVLLGTQRVVQDTQHDEIHLLDFITGEDGINHALHARLHLVQRECCLGVAGKSRQCKNQN